MTRFFLAILAVAMIAMLAPTAQAQTASGNVSVALTLRPLVILYYFDNITVDLDATAMSSFLGGGGQGPDGPTAAYDAVESALTTSSTVPTPGGDPASATIILKNSWAVRSVRTAAATSTQLALTASTSAMTGSNGGSMSSAFALRLAGATGAGSNSVSWTTASFGTPQYGDVVITTDMTGASIEGNYTGADYTIEASHI